MSDLKMALLRAEELLILAKKYVDCDKTAEYDETTCDGYCFIDDCDIAADDIRLLIERGVGE